MSSAILEAENYHRWVFSLFESYLRGSVLEIGMGYGQYTPWIAGRCGELTAVDIDPTLIAGMKNKLPSNAHTVLADLSSIDFPAQVGNNIYSFAVCLNVLEHIEDDAAAMKNLYRVLEPGGGLFVLVPAHASLYGTMDRLAGHQKRYSVPQLICLAKDAGFEIVHSEYLNPIGGVGWWLNAKICRPKTLSDISVNRQIVLFDHYLIPLSKMLNRWSRKLFGQSVWLNVRRPVL